MRTLIKNGLVVDGTGSPGYLADVLVENGRIAQIRRQEAVQDDGIGRADSTGGREDCAGTWSEPIAGKSVKTKSNGNTVLLDAAGRVVCPGFIDTHSHSDLNLFSEPLLLPKISQGITTEILGQDGVSAAPVPAEFREVWQKNVSGLLGELGRPWPWSTVEEYLAALTGAGASTNLLYLVPHGNLRMTVAGLDARPATPTEIERMAGLLADSLAQGCYGMSTGLIYPPCTFADRAELAALCRILARYDKPLVIHQRSEADDILASAQEVIDLGAETGVKIHFSHLKIAGKKNWPLLEELFAAFSEAEAKGVNLSFDQYPYTAGSTMLSVILPPWVHAGGTDQILSRLRDPLTRERIKADIAAGLPGWDNFVEFAGYEGIYVTATRQNLDVIGLNLRQLGEKYGCPPLDAAFDLLVTEQNQVSMVDFYGNEECLVRIMQDPRQNFCTDGLLGGQPHPRVYGSFPRVLGRYVREQQLLTLPEAVRKMTGGPAARFQIQERGLIKEGYHADIVVFDPQTVRDRGTYEEPRQPAAGIEFVLVNGRVIYEGGTDQNRIGGVVKC